MDRPRIRHIAINVEDREKAAQYYKDVFKLEEKERGPMERFTYPTGSLMSP